MMQTQPFEKHVWAEIDLEALRHNFRAVKARAGALPLCAVVKADSYGHGAVQCARVFGGRGSGIQGKISHSSSGRFPYWQRSFIVFSFVLSHF